MATQPLQPARSPSLPWLLRLYPEPWRLRYGAEVAELLLARPPTTRDRLDVIRGAIDARLHPQLAIEPEPRVATNVDRALALAGLIAGLMFGIWGGLIAVASPRWGSFEIVDEELVAMAYGAGLVGLILAICVLIGIAHRHGEEMGSVGAFGALASAVGFLLTLGGAGLLGVLTVMGGMLALAPSLARHVVPGRVAALLVGATAFLAAGMLGFVGSNGQDLLWLFLLTVYGPAWAALGLSLRHGRPAAPISAAPAT